MSERLPHAISMPGAIAAARLRKQRPLLPPITHLDRHAYVWTLSTTSMTQRAAEEAARLVRERFAKSSPP